MCANDSNMTGEDNNMDVLSTAKVLMSVSAGVHNKDRQKQQQHQQQ